MPDTKIFSSFITGCLCYKRAKISGAKTQKRREAEKSKPDVVSFDNS